MKVGYFKPISTKRPGKNGLDEVLVFLIVPVSLSIIAEKSGKAIFDDTACPMLPHLGLPGDDRLSLVSGSCRAATRSAQTRRGPVEDARLRRLGSSHGGWRPSQPPGPPLPRRHRLGIAPQTTKGSEPRGPLPS